MKKIKLSFIWIYVFFFCISCQRSSQRENISIEDHLADVEQWHQNRVNSLKSQEGWLNLVGLYWLKEGENYFGNNPEADFRYEKDNLPSVVGVFILDIEKVYFEPRQQGIFLGESELTEKVIIFDQENQISEKLQWGSLTWNIIKRADVFGLRLRDSEAESLTGFQGIDRYPVSLEWRLEAKFVPYEPIRQIPITNVLGQTTPNPSPGYVEFQKEGNIFKIDALAEGDKLFLIFADQTSGETYGGGRYMYVQRPEPYGTTILDFNKAYNPPCVFTPYATCPLPPRQNVLEIEIVAGEKNFGEH